MAFSFVTSCVSANGDDITEMQDIASDMSCYTFIHKVAQKEGIAEEVLGMFGFDEWAASYGSKKSAKQLFVDDPTVHCYSSMYQGIPCLFVEHSRIEHVFVDNKDLGKVLSEEDACARQLRRSVLADDLNELMMPGDTADQRKKIISQFVKEHKEEFLTKNIPIQSVVAEADSSLVPFAVKLNGKISRESELDGEALSR